MFVQPLAFRDPLLLLQAFAGDPVLAFLDSAAADPRSRWSYLGVEPFAVLTADAGGTRLDGRRLALDPFAALAAEHAALGPAASPAPAPFAGGAIGYLAYEAARYLDRFPLPPADPAPVPDLFAGFYDLVIAFDLAQRQSWLVSSGLPERRPAARARRARQRAEALLRRLAAAPDSLPALDWGPGAPWEALRPRQEEERAIAGAIDYIHAGDIFQANITQCRRARLPAGLDDLLLYRRLRGLSPAPFAALLRCGPELAVFSASPERFLAVAPDGRVETRPIKGTRPRDADPARDRAQAAALAASDKDRAENLMIVDLMRNDLGRVCRLGSVAVPMLHQLESFASVHHLVSVVTGRLRPGLGALDLLRACFPGGSITGAPKIRAMEIIAELEAHRRGVCFGSLFRLGHDGALDSSIAIRTLVRQGQGLTAQAGGGIVADSEPAAEYDEALLKMRPLLAAVAGRKP